MLADFRALVGQKLRDTAGIVTETERETAIQEAVRLYSRVRPQHKVQTITGNGTAFDFALASDFEEGFSRIESIEYPVDKQIAEYLDANEDYRLRRDVTTGVLKLRLLSMVLANAAKAYVSYTLRHTISGTTDTVPVADRDAVAGLGAALCARQLSAYYAQSSDSTIGADSVGYRTKSQEYEAVAKALEATYRRHLGITDEDMVAAASAIGDLDVDLAEGAGDRFFHGRRWR